MISQLLKCIINQTTVTPSLTSINVKPSNNMLNYFQKYQDGSNNVTLHVTFP